MSKNITRGISAALGFLFIITIILSSLAFERQEDVNNFLGLKEPTVTNSDVNAQYYKSEFTETGLATEEGANAMIAAADAFVVTEMEEGAVLLMNRDGALPLAQEERKVTLFGHASADMIYKNRSGGPITTGSERLLTLHDAFIEGGFQLNETLYAAYERSSTQRIKYGIDTVTQTIDVAPASIGEESINFYTNSLRTSFDGYGDAAIVVLAREAGEGTDMVADTAHEADGVPQLSFHKAEADLLKMIKDSGKFKKVIVLINSGNMMDLDWLYDYETYGVDACLFIGQPGTTGSRGIVNLLTGAAVPSGKLPDTIATDSMSSPAMQNMGDYEWTNIDYLMDRRNGTMRSEKYLVYAEGIYVGYKYYESRYYDSVLGQFSADSSIGRTEVHYTAGQPTSLYPDGVTGWDYSTEVTFPFGYGLSYTTFSQTLKSFSYDEISDTFTAVVEVTNTGDTYTGKSAVELYAALPYTDYDRQNMVEKSAIQLVGFGKTGFLAPGKQEEVTVTVPRYYIASYDEKGAGTYILEDGDYWFAIGNDVHDALNHIIAASGVATVAPLKDQFGNIVEGNPAKAQKYTVETFDAETYRYNSAGNEVKNLFQGDSAVDVNSHAPGTVVYLTRGGGGNNWASSFPTTVPVSLDDHMIYLLNGLVYNTPEGKTDVSQVTLGQDAGLQLVDMIGVAANDPKWDTFVQQMNITELLSVIDDYKGLRDTVERIGRNKIIRHSDGPGGLECTYDFGASRNATCYVSGCLTSASWNNEIMRRRGELLGEECLYSNCQVLWGPGVNIHRTPYSGRNFEYFSEDPILTLICAGIVENAIASKGTLTGGKHFVCNDQEVNRNGVATFLTEQTLRETYIRPFETLMKNSSLLYFMCSENRLGLTAVSLNRTLLTDLVRNEWGYDGVIISDAANDLEYMHPREGVAAGTDMWCLTKKYGVDIRKHLQTDAYLIETLQLVNKHVYYSYVNSNYINGLTRDIAVQNWTPWWQPVLIASNVVLGLAFLGAVLLFLKKAYGKGRKPDEK